MSELRREELKAPPRRRWLRRLTYGLAAGAVLVGAGALFLRSPSGGRWIMGRISRILAEETGLTLQAEGLEIHPFEGRVVLRGLDLGKGLLRARELEATASMRSLVAGMPRVYGIRLQDPVVMVDKARLDQIRLKPSGPKEPARWQVDAIQVQNGRFQAGDDAWGPFRGEGTFRVVGNGKGPGKLDVTVVVSQARLTGHGATLPAEVQVKVQVSDPRLGWEGDLRVGRSRVALKGGWQVKDKVLEATGETSLDLAPLVALAGRPGLVQGRLEAAVAARGPLDGLTWSAEADGHDLALPGHDVAPGDALLEVSGGRDVFRLGSLSWVSAQGRLEAAGSWRPAAGTTLTLAVADASLLPLARLVRFPALAPARASLQAKVSLSGLPGDVKGLGAITATVNGGFRCQGTEAGRLVASLKGGALRVETLSLDLPDLQVKAEGDVRFKGRSLAGVQGHGEVTVDAEEVAQTLHAWDIGLRLKPDPADPTRPPKRALPMGGRVTAQATAGWNPVSGLMVSGHVEVDRPRWEAAMVGRLRSDLTILGRDLNLRNVQLEHEGGLAQGDLWLTWADREPGEPQMDTCYGFFRLPLEEGLRAADLDPKVIQVAGQGSGWARVHGPFKGLMVEGRLEAEGVDTYGVTVPAVGTDFSLDVARNRISLRDLRIGESREALGAVDGAPSGGLALSGALDMDFDRLSWRGELRGAVDSGPLSLPGPRIQSRVEVRLDGPLAVPLGPWGLPALEASFSRGRVFFRGQSLEGIEGNLRAADGEVAVQVGLAGHDTPILKALGWRKGEHFIGGLDLSVGAHSADTAFFAQRLTGDVLRDVRLEARAEGVWSEAGLRWSGQLDQMEARLTGGRVVQERPSLLEGTDQAMALNLELTGRGEDGLDPATHLALRGTLPFSPTQPLGLRAEGAMDLAPLKTVVDALLEVPAYSAMGDLRPAGRTTLAVTLGGTFADPRVDGFLDLKDGRLRMGNRSQSAEAVNGRLLFLGREVLIPEAAPLKGRLASGDLTSWGRVSWTPLGLEDYALRMRLKDFQFRDLPEGFELDGSVEATFQRDPLRGDLLSGALEARRMLYKADIRLQDLLAPSPADTMGSGSSLGTEDPLTRIGLDLDLKLLQPWQIDTNLLKIQGRPADRFQVRGSLGNPLLQGRMELVPGGRLTNFLPAGDVVIERGAIGFKSEFGLNPELDLTGRVDVTPFVVNLDIRGLVTGLQFSPTSTPNLRQDEIIAILINPSLAETVGTLGAGNVGTAAHNGLASTGTGLLSTLAIAGFQEQVRQTLNLDRVSFALRTGTGSPETTLTVGKTFDLFGRRTPFVVTHKDRAGQVTLSGQVEWRIGDYVLQLGASRTGTDALRPSGEMRYTWRPR